MILKDHHHDDDDDDHDQGAYNDSAIKLVYVHKLSSAYNDSAIKWG